MVMREFSSISALVGSGVGVGFGLKTGGGGGAPSCGRRPGPVWAGVGAAVGEGVAVPVWRGRESVCCAREALPIINEIAAIKAARATMALRRALRICTVPSPI